MSTHAAARVVPIRRTVRCRSCDAAYAPAEASICNCATEHRSLECPSCGACACSNAPAEIRARFRDATAEELRRTHDQKQQTQHLQVTSATLPRPLILVADDNFDIRSVVKRQLESLGYGVVAVENGEDAWQAVLEFRPDVALLDALMPKGDGREISQRIKAHPELRTRTVVMTSLYASAKQKAEAFRMFRVDAYLVKPVRPEVLEDTMSRLIEIADPS